MESNSSKCIMSVLQGEEWSGSLSSNSSRLGLVFVKTLSNTTISINIDQTFTIGELKQIISAVDGIPSCHQRLVSGCRELGDNMILTEQCDTATLHLRLMGGNPEPNPRLMPVTWWLGYCSSYQDGRTGEEGRICHALTDFEFERPPYHWCSNLRLHEWERMLLIEFEGVC